jgi:DNA adenine methylase
VSDQITPPLKWHGGKHYLASKIVAMMPLHTHYVEPFAGGLSVLLAADPEGRSEVVNDLNYDLTTFWRVLQYEEHFAKFRRQVEAIPFSEVEWNVSNEPGALTIIDRAVDFFVRCRQSLAGRMESFAPLSKTRTRRGMNEQASAWLNAVEGLPMVHARLKRVVILNRDAIEVIQQQDGPETLFYLDPPYLAATRTAKDVYAHEMSAADHERLLGVIKQCKGRVMLSGYPSQVYEDHLHDWQRHEFTLPNQAASGSKKRKMTEVLWCNFVKGGDA